MHIAGGNDSNSDSDSDSGGDGREGVTLSVAGRKRGRNCRRVVWHNMREEATVFINGSPFVLRESKRPFNNMLEYTVGGREGGWVVGWLVSEHNVVSIGIEPQIDC